MRRAGSTLDLGVSMKRIPRRIFVAGLGPREEFKREAIKLVNDQGLTIAEASKKLAYGVA